MRHPRIQMALIGAMAGLAGCASVDPANLAHPRSCVAASRVVAWSPVNPRALDVRVRGGESYRIHLRHDCPDLLRNREIILLESRPFGGFATWPHWGPWMGGPYGYGDWRYRDWPFMIERHSSFPQRICGRAGEVVAFPDWGRRWSASPWTCAIQGVEPLVRLAPGPIP